MQDGEVYNPFQLFTGIFIPEWLARSRRISAGAKLAFGRLARYAGKNGMAYPSMETLADEIGYGVRQTRNHIVELETEGLIRRVARVSEIGQTSNIYEFLWRQALVSGESPTISGAPRQSSAASSLPNFAAKESHIEESHIEVQQQHVTLLSESEWPLTTFAVQSRFPSADSFFVLRLIQDSVQAAVSCGVEADLSDRKLSQIVCESIQGDFARPGRTAGLLLKTVPQIIRSRVNTFEVQQKILGKK